MRIIRGNLTVYTPSRALEWHCAISMLIAAVILALPGNTFGNGSQWGRFADLMSEQGWALTLGGIAGLRIAALLINGHARRTPALRAATAAMGAGLWLMVSLLFFVPGQPVNIMFGIAAVLCLSDLVSTFKAGVDAATSDWIWERMDEAPPAPMPWRAVP